MRRRIGHTGIVLESVLAQLATNTRLLEPTERNLGVELVVTVNPDGTRLELASDGVGAREVLGEDGRGETVVGRVGLLDDFLFGVKGGHDDDGAKDLLLDNLHVGGDVAEDGLAVSQNPGEDRDDLRAR